MATVTPPEGTVIVTPFRYRAATADDELDVQEGLAVARYFAGDP
jgi:hypothetical protein